MDGLTYNSGTPVSFTSATQPLDVNAAVNSGGLTIDSYGDGWQEPTAQTDPFAQWGGQAAYNNLVSNFDAQKQNIFGSANSSIGQTGENYRTSVRDLLHGFQRGQQGIDLQAQQNEASRIQGGRGILDMIGRGVKSSGVYLANRNAGNSSAAGAIAKAYGEQGRRQMTNIGNQYAGNQQKIDLAQQEQDYQIGNAPTDFHNKMLQDVNGIVTNVGQQLGALDAQMVQASLPERIAIEQEKERIRGEAMAALQQYDTQLATGAQGIKATDRNTNLTQANQLLQQGMAPEDMFNYTTEAPLQLAGSGPSSSSLPLYSAKRRIT